MLKRKLDYLIGVPLVWIFSKFMSRPSSPPAEIRKILVIKLAAAGDTVLLIPVLRSIRKKFPQAEIHWIVSPVNIQLALPVPYVNRLWNLKLSSFSQLISTIMNLRKQKYDVVIDFEQWARGSALVAFFSGARVRYGFDTPGHKRGKIFTSVYTKKYEDHEIYDFYNLAQLLSPSPLDRDSKLELWETEEGKETIARLCRELSETTDDSLRVLIQPGCGSDGAPREWPLENYATLGNWLLNKVKARIFITGGPEETQKTLNLAQLLNGKAKNLGGLLSWNATISLTKKMDLVVSGNTGIMHIAAALKRKQIALHGPTNVLLWGPLNENAKTIQAPCDGCPSLKLGFEYTPQSRDCMRNIEISEVKKATLELVQKESKIY